tara:strand:- start:528 stop:887 length:360 start_codon:yes stop_codon:yes gene_type:complete
MGEQNITWALFLGIADLAAVRSLTLFGGNCVPHFCGGFGSVLSRQWGRLTLPRMNKLMLEHDRQIPDFKTLSESSAVGVEGLFPSVKCEETCIDTVTNWGTLSQRALVSSDRNAFSRSC